MNNSPVTLQSGGSPTTTGVELFTQTKYSQASDAFTFQTAFENQFQSTEMNFQQADDSQLSQTEQNSFFASESLYKDRVVENKAQPVRKKENTSLKEKTDVKEADSQNAAPEEIQEEPKQVVEKKANDKQEDVAVEQPEPENTKNDAVEKNENSEKADAQDGTVQKDKADGEQAVAQDKADKPVDANAEKKAEAVDVDVPEKGAEVAEKSASDKGQYSAKTPSEQNAETAAEQQVEGKTVGGNGAEIRTDAENTAAIKTEDVKTQTTTSQQTVDADAVKQTETHSAVQHNEKQVEAKTAEVSSEQSEGTKEQAETQSQVTATDSSQQQQVQAVSQHPQEQVETVETQSTEGKVEQHDTAQEQKVDIETANVELDGEEIELEAKSQTEELVVDKQAPQVQSKPVHSDAKNQNFAEQKPEQNLDNSAHNSQKEVARQDTGRSVQNLEVEADVKVKNLEIEKTDNPELEAENGSNLLKNLAAKSKHVAQNHNAQRHMGQQGFNQNNSQQGQTPNQGQNWSDNYLNQDQKHADLLNGLFRKGKEAIANNQVPGKAKASAAVHRNAVNLDVIAKQTQAFTNSAKVNAPVFTNGTTLKNIALIQELMGRIQGMLKGAAVPGTKLSMDFSSTNLGQMSLEIQQRDGNLTVNLDVGSESSRQQLMDQRDELASQLRQMGFRQVAVNVSSGNDHHDFQHRNHSQLQEGNSNIENVRLAGDDEMDLAQILSYNFNS